MSLAVARPKALGDFDLRARCRSRSVMTRYLPIARRLLCSEGRSGQSLGIGGVSPTSAKPTLSMATELSTSNGNVKLNGDPARRIADIDVATLKVTGCLML